MLIISLILVNSCFNNYKFRKKDKMEAAIASIAVATIANSDEVKEACGSMIKLVIKPITSLLNLANVQLDDKVLSKLEQKTREIKKRAKLRLLLDYIKTRNINKIVKLLSEDEKEEGLINLNEELTLGDGSSTTYTNLILSKGCYEYSGERTILNSIIKNFPKKWSENLYGIHLACILGTEDFVELLIDNDSRAVYTM
tara:strand:- start:6676 stop:7269 length:594 start_codon:yes stop_codon:yes gene_type:complete